MDKDVSLLLEHNALTYYFNIMNNITLVFCIIYVTIYFSQTRHASLSLLVFLLCFCCLWLLQLVHLLAILHFSEYTKHGISHSVCAKHDNVHGCDACKIQTHMNVLCYYRRDISLCMIL